MAISEIQWDGMPISKPGLYRGVSMAAYHQQLTDTPSISSSGKRTIWSKSPRHYFDDSYLNPDRPEDEEERPHFNVGRAAHHLLILGRKGFDDEFVVRPDEFTSYRTNAAKAWKVDCLAAGLTIITPTELDDIVGMAKSLGQEPLVRAGILDGLIERTIVYRDPETGAWVKSRPDSIPDDSDFSDLKTTTDVRDDALERTIREFGYHQQAATVRSAAQHACNIEMRDFTLVFVEKKRPYCVRIVPIDPEDIDRGASQNRVALHRFAQALESGYWPGPGASDEAKYMGLSPYWRGRLDARLMLEIPEIEGAMYAKEHGQ